jgi:arylsulfatase A-like enzyme
MTRRDLLGGVAAAAAGRANPVAQPSIVFLTGIAPRPGGTHHGRAYAANPESGPALAAILSGRFPHASGVLRDGMPLAAGEQSLAAVLQQASYRTAFAGEWPLGPAGPRAHGFGEWLRDVAAVDGFLASDRNRPIFLLAHRMSIGAGMPVTNAITIEAALYGTEPLLPFERSVRVSVESRFPGGMRNPIAADTLLSHVDLMPTLLAACGAAIPAAVHGRDLASGARAESVFAYGSLGTEAEWRMIVRGFDKLVVNRAMEVTHLFNLSQDPAEENNLASEPSHQRRRDELRAHLMQWMRRIGDRMDPSGLKVRG